MLLCVQITGWDFKGLRRDLTAEGGSHASHRALHDSRSFRSMEVVPVPSALEDDGYLSECWVSSPLCILDI